MSKTLYILNGPNLNRLGTREPEIYGTDTLSDIEKACAKLTSAAGLDLVFRQTNAEGTLVDYVQEAADHACALILNAGAYTHTSVALHDALRLVNVPVIELHLSNPAAREDFRRTNYVAPAATANICGFGAMGYDMAVTAALRLVKT
ncbi:MAG: type II 3-dehydroquinate dehydratase [Robiginitomaculum sp.]|nr:MAG: type II 3-dehydroquinate dehydratase [Robiginitomaculum sp.]